MAPLSKSAMACEQDILEISAQLGKIDIENAKTQEEQCTYNINEDNDDDNPTEKHITITTNTSNLENCAHIKEKGPIEREKVNNNRGNPYSRFQSSGVPCILNNEDENVINNYFSPNLLEFNQFSLNNIQFDDLNRILSADNNNNSDYVFTAPLFNDNLTDYQAINIPTTIEQNFPQTSSNTAEKELSNFIDKNKKLKQMIWIQVNIEVEQKLIAMLREKISSLRFTQIDLNYIYAIIIRLMKEESDVNGKNLLVEYFCSDDILFRVALKRNVLLMNFILEVYQNLGVNPNQENVLHQIVDYSGVDLYEMFECLLDKKFYNKPSLNIFDVNCVDSARQTPLLIVLKNIALEKGLSDVNTKYFDLILSRNPDLNYVTNEGKSILEQAIAWNCDQITLQKIRLYCATIPIIYDDATNPIYSNYNEWKQYDYLYK